MTPLVALDGNGPAPERIGVDLDELAALSDEPRPILTLDPTDLHGPSARAAFVLHLRQLASQIERGELHGARTQWREGLHHAETVTITATQVRLQRHEIRSPERPADYDGDAVLAETERLADAQARASGTRCP